MHQDFRAIGRKKQGAGDLEQDPMERRYREIKNYRIRAWTGCYPETELSGCS